MSHLRTFLSLLLFLGGCAPAHTSGAIHSEMGQRQIGKPPIIHCFDGVEHVKGSLPYVLGGTCVHSPTAEILEAYHRDGLLLDYDLNRLKQLYIDKGIKTIDDHQGCNNYCPWGPHLVKGGHCMVPPTPGTKNYEEVLAGKRAPAEVK